MPPLIVAAAAAIGGTALVRLGLRAARRVRADIERMREEVERAGSAMMNEPQMAPVRRLRRDPVTGIYRPE